MLIENIFYFVNDPIDNVGKIHIIIKLCEISNGSRNQSQVT